MFCLFRSTSQPVQDYSYISMHFTCIFSCPVLKALSKASATTCNTHHMYTHPARCQLFLSYIHVCLALLNFLYDFVIIIHYLCYGRLSLSMRDCPNTSDDKNTVLTWRKNSHLVPLPQSHLFFWSYQLYLILYLYTVSLQEPGPFLACIWHLTF